MDEVQLMDVGLATSAQLQAIREEDSAKGIRPCHTWWMSATLQSDWLKSIDTAPYHEHWMKDPCKVEPDQRKGGLWDIRKSLQIDAIDAEKDTVFAERILKEHEELHPSEFGRITLVVCNTVDRACKTFDALRDKGRKDGLELVHSRFRPAEREAWRELFLSRSACTSDVDRIIVATQVVEAGVDISAGSLITELAPWPSLVQRFGRCARYGGTGKVLVVDRKTAKKDNDQSDNQRDDRSSAPYSPDELNSASDALKQIVERGVGIAALEAFEESLGPQARAQLYPYAPDHLLMRREFDELFDTTPDLTGADLDISRFIRSGDERDLQVFWIEVEKPKKGERPKTPSKTQRPQRKELCSVPFLKARDWLCEKDKSKLKASKRAWVWDWIDGEWKTATREGILPGRIICVAADSGGYSIERGFTADSTTGVPLLPLDRIDPQAAELDNADNQQDGEVTGETWKTIACHTFEVAKEAALIATQLNLSEEIQDALQMAAHWHDWGKSHPAFQGCIRDFDEVKRLNRYDLAKAPDKAWDKKNRYRYLDNSETRPGFRHELASALGLFSVLQMYAPKHPALLGPWSDILAKLGKSPSSSDPRAVPSPFIQRLLDCSAEKFDLLAYLVASHHGKVRVSLHASPSDQDYQDRDGQGLPIRGVREGDKLPSVVLVPGEPSLPTVTLTLAPSKIGLSEQTGISWRERTLGVMERYGPAGLAFLEAIMVAADRRASRLKTNDPALTTEAKQ
jgi:CRISPR-associated endonuclease/helicase Cas3